MDVTQISVQDEHSYACAKDVNPPLNDFLKFKSGSVVNAVGGGGTVELHLSLLFLNNIKKTLNKL